MSLTLPTTEDLKRQARRMRDHFAEKNIDISHSAALEAIAKQHGYKDWNILSALINRQSMTIEWPEFDEMISGTYLGHNFTGKILKIQTCTIENLRRYTIKFDDPIDVVASKHFSSFRRQINCFLNKDRRSTDHKGRVDNIVQLA